MTAEDRESRLSEALEDYHRRRALGESPAASEYRDVLGSDYEDFLGVMNASAAFDAAISPPVEPELPRSFGPYILQRVLGRGSMGIVYEAFHRDLARRVALKVLRTGFDTERQAYERFWNEARTCAQVKHPHVVQIYEVGEAEGRPYYSMDLLDGETLASRIDAGTAPGVRELFAGMAGVADGLEALHRAGIVHRDVKPSNILIRPNGQMILVDFGLARGLASANLTLSGQAIGTPLYMSPEQMLGRREGIDARSDVYGLGATLYEALAGRPPFATRDLSVLIRQILFQRPEPIRSMKPDIPAAAEAVVMKALEKRREDRYTTAGALRDDLRGFAAGQGTKGKPISSARRAARAARRWIPLAAVFLAMLGVGAWLWMHRDAHLVFEAGYPPHATITVDGGRKYEFVGGQRLLIDVTPGKHVVRVETVDHEPREYSVTPTSGDGEHMPAVFVGPLVKAPQPETMKAWFTYLDAMSFLPRPMSDMHRGGYWSRGVIGRYAMAALPQGRVRPMDLSTAYIQVTRDWNVGAAQIRFFLDGSTEDLVPPIPFEPKDDGTKSVELPRALAEAVKPGDVVVWGVYPMGWQPGSDRKPRRGELAPTTAKLIIGPADAAPGLGRLEARLVDADPADRAIAIGKALLDAGLPTAAAKLVLDVPREKRGFYAWLVLHEAFESLSSDLQDFAPSFEAREALVNASDTAAYKAVFGE